MQFGAVQTPFLTDIANLRSRQPFREVFLRQHTLADFHVHTKDLLDNP
jgi:hypothetical protein